MFVIHDVGDVEEQNISQTSLKSVNIIPSSLNKQANKQIKDPEDNT